MKNPLLLVLALFWLLSGVYVVSKPTSFHRNIQYPWKKLPVWAAKLLGVGLFLGGMLMLRAYVRAQ